jgi:DNA-binding SARP family transcriptional activator
MTDTDNGLYLVNGPYAVMDGCRKSVPEGSKRLLVLIALRGAVSRRAAAELLWPDVDQVRAAGNLRSAAWRLRCAQLPLLVEHDGALRLSPGVSLDVDVIRAEAASIVSGRVGIDDSGWFAAAVAALDLLPGWYDEWVSAERDRLRTVMLAAIDAVSLQLSRAGRCAEAIDAALVAVTADPLRDSSQTALINAHLGEGNLVEARRAYLAYRRAMSVELGLDPPGQLARLVGLPNLPKLQFRPTARRSVLIAT